MYCMDIIDYRPKACEERRFKQNCNDIEKERLRRIAVLNGEIHQVKMHYRDLQDDRHVGAYGDIGLPPGFRFCHNGDTKFVRVGWSASTMANMHLLDSMDVDESSETGSVTGERSPRSQLTTVPQLMRAIADIESDLQRPNSARELSELNTRLNSARSSLAATQSHARSIEGRLSVKSAATGTSAVDDVAASTKSAPVSSTKSKKWSTHRFNRLNHRAACVACEFRLKSLCGGRTALRATASATHSTPASTTVAIRRWNPAPQGYFVPKAELPANGSSVNASKRRSTTSASLAIGLRSRSACSARELGCGTDEKNVFEKNANVCVGVGPTTQVMRCVEGWTESGERRSSMSFKLIGNRVSQRTPKLLSSAMSTAARPENDIYCEKTVSFLASIDSANMRSRQTRVRNELRKSDLPMKSKTTKRQLKTVSMMTMKNRLVS